MLFPKHLISTTPLALSLTLAPLTSAATFSCRRSFGPSALFSQSSITDFKTFVDSGVVPPIPVGQGQSQMVPFPGTDLAICIINDFLFVVTTIFPDELSEFLGLAIGCFTSGQDPDKGFLDGDNSLDIRAQIVHKDTNCASLGS